MIESGTLLQDRYRVVKLIGQGGMGTVYVATDERFHSTVAIKQTFFDDPTLRKAFEREAQLLNHLRHAALPKVSDHFIEGNGQFLVMEYIVGDDLSALLEERSDPFPLADVLRWADELLDALDYLHTHEPPVVHRDIKPQNLKLTTRGQIVLLDFGLAKGATTETRANMTASVFGYSRHYAPLEQIQGTGTDARSDLYSLAATLYHLLTGKVPVDALTRASAIINNQTDPLRLAHLAHPQVPEAISRVVQRALAQKATLRHATAAEMRAALRQASRGLVLDARPTPAANFKSDQSAINELTLTTPALDGVQSATDLRTATQLRETAYATDETTLVEATQYAARRPVRHETVTAVRMSPPARQSSAKLLGVVVALLLVACAVVAYTLTQRRDKPAVNSASDVQAPLGAPTDAQPSAPATTGSNTADTSQNPLAPTQSAPAQSQSSTTHFAGEAPTTSAQTPSGDANTTRANNARGGNAESSEANRGAALGTSTDGAGLVIQRPGPQPSNNAAQDDAHLAETLHRKQAPPPEEERLPPPDGNRPPPPPFGGPPPPLRRPPVL